MIAQTDVGLAGIAASGILVALASGLCTEPDVHGDVLVRELVAT